MCSIVSRSPLTPVMRLGLVVPALTVFRWGPCASVLNQKFATSRCVLRGIVSAERSMAIGTSLSFLIEEHQ